MISQLSATCQCGFKKNVTASQAGSTQICPACQSELQVPSLSELKQQPAGRTIGVSKLGKLIRSIEDQRIPFDGTCQLCLQTRGTNTLPVSVFYIENEQRRLLNIPCTFCDLCAGDVRSGLRTGVLKNLGKNLVKGLWLLFMLPIVMFVAFVLPFIGIVFVLYTMYALFHQITRRRANPFLLKHLDTICQFADVMDDYPEYVIKNGRVTPAQPIRKNR